MVKKQYLTKDQKNWSIKSNSFLTRYIKKNFALKLAEKILRIFGI